MTENITESFMCLNTYGGKTFTRGEAGRCRIIHTKSVDISGNHAYWLLKVEDEDGNSYEWKDYEEALGVSKAGLKAAMITHLMNYVAKVPFGEEDIEVNKTTVSQSDRGINEELGQ